MTGLIRRLTVILTLVCLGTALLALLMGNLLREDEIVYAAYLNSASHIYQMSPTRHISVAVTHNQTENSSPAWSPDGQSIVFVSKYGGVDQILVMDAYNGRFYPVTDTITEEYTPAWSPDGRYIAFLRLNGAGTDLFVTDLQLGSTRRLTKTTHAYYPPAWSPDSRYITFAADIYSKNATDLFKLDIQTDEITPLIETSAQEIFNTWSPDGHYVLYMVKGVVNSIYLWDTQTHQSILLDQTHDVSSIPSWSSDSRSIIFSASLPNGQHGLFRLDVTDCLQTSERCTPELLAAAYGMFMGPRWQPRTS